MDEMIPIDINNMRFMKFKGNFDIILGSDAFGFYRLFLSMIFLPNYYK